MKVKMRRHNTVYCSTKDGYLFETLYVDNPQVLLSLLAWAEELKSFMTKLNNFHRLNILEGKSKQINWFISLCSQFWVGFHLDTNRVRNWFLNLSVLPDHQIKKNQTPDMMSHVLVFLSSFVAQACVLLLFARHFPQITCSSNNVGRTMTPLSFVIYRCLSLDTHSNRK